MIRLDAAPAALPLAFEAGQHLTGQALPYLSSGSPLESDGLAAALAGEGLGLHPVTISGFYAAEEGAVNLSPWTRTIEVAGTLDPDTLARLIHQESRQFMEGVKTRTGGTVPELYVTSIQIGDGPPPKKEKPPKKKRRPKIVTVIRYRDSKTGRLVGRSTWKRSRSHLPKGKRGRYVREITKEIR